MAVTAERSPEVRVLLVDDHQVVRSGLKALMELEEDLAVVGEAGTGAEAIAMVVADPPDLVVLDVRLPDRSGISVCHEITTRFPHVKVLILTSYADEAALASSLNAGASGFALKNVRATELLGEMRRVMQGEMGIAEQLGNRVVDPFPISELSPQEQSIAGYLAEGLTNRDIALRMDLAEKTVKNYVSNVLTKLGMKRRSEAAAYVARIQTMTGVPLQGRRSEGVRVG